MQFPSIFSRTCAAAVLAAAFAGCGSEPVDYFKTGEEALAAGKLPEAIDALTVATKEDPGHCDAWLLLGEALLKHGDLEKADETARTLISLEPAGAAALMLDGKVAFARQQWRRAQADFNALTSDKYPDAVRASGYNGFAAATKAGFPARKFDIQSALLLALQMNPSNAAATYHLAILYESDDLKFKREAKACYDAYTKMAAADAEHSAIAAKRSARLAAEIKDEEAKASAVSGRDLAKAKRAADTARRRAREKQYDKAEASFREALKADPLDGASALQLARVLEEKARSIRPSGQGARRKRSNEARKEALKKALDAYMAAQSANDFSDSTVAFKEACLGTARLSSETGYPQTASEALFRAIAMDGGDKRTFHMMFETLATRGKEFMKGAARMYLILEDKYQPPAK